jgi:hypothetical protein|tara:strand:- start:98 stop:208 length:111 start_codon:yes stop_codon:yes gene_type:complete
MRNGKAESGKAKPKTGCTNAKHRHAAGYSVARKLLK